MPEPETLGRFIDKVSGYLHTEPWVLQVFIVVLLTVTAVFVAAALVKGLRKRVGLTRTFWDDALLDALSKPLTVLIYVVGLAFAMQIIFTETGAVIFEAVEPIRDVAVIAIITWFLSRFITRAADNYINSLHARGDSYDRTAVDAIAKLLRISVLITAALVVLQTLGFSITGVLAFGGVGGIAVGFAAKDMLANFFGGMMVYLDRPFSIGDWIRSPDRNIEGTVEEIGWRLTRIRTFDKRPLYVPNYVFNQIALENPSRMTNRRIKEIVGVRYDDAAKVAAIVTDIREMLSHHDDIDNDKTTIVNFDTFAPSSLDILIYTFTKTRDWVEYHAIKEKILLKVIEIIESYGAECAFPTSTVHIPGGVNLDRSEDESDPAIETDSRRPEQGTTSARQGSVDSHDDDGG